ncbi:tetratricopeptide repeat protein [Kallotenue papyrolyticum]|uniref:tetratricopeptide repeat protein n=1 Tax=Kallotenue papyrolyticum TaxID=1325125 RepID=UPI0004B413C6|nr:tetratricopeptide repeat protein [Kallotenue papyrolyticum]
MALRRERSPHVAFADWRMGVRQLLLTIPEAALLLSVLLVGALTHFPVALGLPALVIAAFFGLRLILLALAARRLEQGAYASAAWLARQALRLNPWSPDGLLLLAQSHLRRGDDSAAEATLRRALALHPTDEALQSALAALLLSQAQPDARQPAVRKDMPTIPEQLTPALAQQRAWLALHGERDAALARAIVLRAAPERLAPRQALPLLIILAEALLELGAHAESLRTLDRIEAGLRRCPRAQQAELLYHLGRLYVAHGRSGTAYFRRSVELDPHGRYAQHAWRSAVGG